MPIDRIKESETLRKQREIRDTWVSSARVSLTAYVDTGNVTHLLDGRQSIEAIVEIERRKAEEARRENCIHVWKPTPYLINGKNGKYCSACTSVLVSQEQWDAVMAK